MVSETHETPNLWFGSACGLIAAVLYTLTNIALRDCVDMNAYLVSAVKATPTVLVLGPVLGWMSTRGEKLVASRKRLPQFMFASLIAQFFGNAAFQRALEYIGLAATVPITLGVLIVAGAALGVILLKEHLSRQKLVAMATLILAVIVLSIPVETNDHAVADSPVASAADEVQSRDTSSFQSSTMLRVLIGSSWAALSGLAYSFFGVSLRQTLQSGMKPTTTMFISGLIGTITLWSYSVMTLGSEAIMETTYDRWLTMFAAGVLNFSAFIAITLSLRLLPVVAVNLINASQVAMAAVAGVLLFAEPVTSTLLLGTTLTFGGLVMLARRE